MMKKLNPSHYLQHDNKNLGSLLARLDQFKRWNDYFRQCLNNEAHIMDHCHVVNFTANAFIVMTDSPHWLTRIRFHVGDLVPKLRQYPGLENLKAICCKTQPNSPQQRFKKTPKKPLTLKPTTAKSILAIAEKLEDKKIRTILEKIASHVTQQEDD